MRLTSTSAQPRHQGSRAAALAVVALALLLAPLCAVAGAASADRTDGSGLKALGRTVIAALDGSAAGDAVDTLGNSLALLGTRYRLEAEADGGGDVPDTSTRPWEVNGEIDPSKLPPASAGSNGTHVPHTSRMSRDEIFAHSRGDGESTAILLAGIALAPPDAPQAVKDVVNNANTIVGRPYVWGGGHSSWYSYGYDCSGSVSFALFGGGLIPRPLTSGELEGWGEPGPGRWITVYANPGHTFAEIAGLRWDTVGDERGSGPRWHLATADTSGFVARHPPGL